MKEKVDGRNVAEKERHTWSINEEEAEMVRTMFDMIEDSASTYDVAKRMNEFEAWRGSDFE